MPRFPTGLCFAATCAIIVGGLVQAATTSPSADTPNSTSLLPAEKSNRAREGTSLVDVLGHFKIAGDRATFYPSEGNSKYGGLENLNLERVAIVVSENPDDLEWSVSGLVTEYRGSNYLLITKAVLKTKLPPSERTDRRPGAAPPASSQAAAR